jgi:thiol-disulfide isomerase/thioredoxin
MKRLLAALLFTVAVLPNVAVAGDLRPFVRGTWQEIRRTHAGQPMVVHFWGVTCGPCRVEMPQWGALLAERRDLDLVTINADLVPNEETAATAMLAKAGLVTAENWIFADGFVERLRYEIDPQWRGEIPLTMLVARDGSVTTVEGIADLAQVRAWLDGQSQSTP